MSKPSKGLCCSVGAVLFGRGCAAGETAVHQHEICAVVRPLGHFWIVAEIGGDGFVRGQGNPKLHGMQGFDAFGCLFGMADAVVISRACGHQIDLFGADSLAVAEAVLVQHFAFQHPSEGLQIGVRMCANLHAVFLLGKMRGAGMVEKAPCADGAVRAVGQQPGNRNAADIVGFCGDFSNGHGFLMSAGCLKYPQSAVPSLSRAAATASWSGSVATARPAGGSGRRGRGRGQFGCRHRGLRAAGRPNRG